LFQLFLELIQVWGDQSSLTHTSYEQHHYLTQAFVVCVAFLTEQHKQEHKDGITIYFILQLLFLEQIGSIWPKSEITLCHAKSSTFQLSVLGIF
jgi:hypothetical protein